MRNQEWIRALLAGLTIATAAAAGGCKSFTERYIALEVWKYERCFGHLPPGFTPPGSAAPMAATPGRVCGGGTAPCAPPTAGCDPCQGQGMPVDEGVPVGVGVPAGPGGAPTVGPSAPTPAGVTAGRPIVISDEVVIP